MNPPSAGPETTANFMAAVLIAIARARSPDPTSAGTIACWAGAWMARAIPSLTLAMKITSRPTNPAALPHARSTDAKSCTMMASESTRRRSTRSASWPAGIVKRSVGTNCARPTRPRSHVLEVRSYICQPSATSSIWLPIVDRPRVHRKKWKPRERWCGAAFPPAETLIEFLKASLPVCRSRDVSFGKAGGAYDAGRWPDQRQTTGGPSAHPASRPRSSRHGFHHVRIRRAVRPDPRRREPRHVQGTRLPHRGHLHGIDQLHPAAPEGLRFQLPLGAQRRRQGGDARGPREVEAWRARTDL